MALPPGTFGWVGSGFDCACECNFAAGFAYAGNEPPAWTAGPEPVCLLLFAVGNLTNGCTPIDIDTADLTVELEVNGTPITDPLITDSTLNLKYWQKWKPVAGDVYTATVTLDCGGGVITIREYSFTIPTPANLGCTCCTEQIPDYLVITGGSGCCDMVNGTWALTLAGGTCAAGTRTYEYVDNDIFSAPSDPCSAGRCYEVADGSDTYFLWRRGIRLEVVMPASAGPDNVTVRVSTSYRAYRLRSGICSLFSSQFTTTYTYTMSCAEGNAGTATGGSSLIGTGSTFATPCSSAPSVELFFQ